MAERIVRWAPVAAKVGTQFSVMVGDAFAQRHHQRDGVVGDLTGAVVGRVANGYAELAETLDIHVVVADAILHEDAAFAQLVDVLRWEIADDGVGVGPLVVGYLGRSGAKVHLETR